MIESYKALRLAWPAIFTVLVTPAFAQTSILPYASEKFEYNSNVFDLPDAATAKADDGDPKLSDSNSRTAAGADFSYQWDRQRFYATAEGRYIEYDHFKYLSHSEYMADGGLDWKMLDIFDGTIMGKIERYMAPFVQRDTATDLAIDLDRYGVAKFNIQVAPEWRIETGFDYHDLDSPIQFYPEYGLSETTGKIALKYAGFSHLTYGITADYTHGEYRNAPIQGSYEQTDLDLTVAYAVSSLSAFSGAIGDTRRDQGQNQGNLSALTGSFSYTRQLSGKTSLQASLTRLVNSYVGAGGSEEDTSGALRANYQATYKIGIAVGVQYLRSKFLAETVPGIEVPGSSYHSPSASFTLNYQALRWLLIRPYATWQRRSSDLENFNFTGTVVGIEFLAKKPAPVPQQGQGQGPRP